MSRINIRSPFASDFSKQETEAKVPENLKKATQVKIDMGKETSEEAWERIFAMKNSDKDNEKLAEVKKYMEEGKLSREESKRGKRFSKSEALKLYSVILEEKRAKRLEEIRKSIPDNYILVDTEDKLKQLKEHMRKSIEDTEVLSGFDIETYGNDGTESLNPFTGNVAGFSWSYKDTNYYLPLNHEDRTTLNLTRSARETVLYLKEELEGIKTAMHNAPFDCKWMYIHYEVDMITNLYVDTRVMAFMLNEEERSYQLKALTQNWLGMEADFFDELFPVVYEFNKVPLDIALFYAAGDTEKTVKLYEFIENIWSDPKNNLPKVSNLFYEVEMPVLRTFIWSDIRGIKFDTNMAEELWDKQTEIMGDIQRKVEEMYGQEINLNSPKQLQTMIYDYFCLPDISRKRKTDKDTLAELANEHEVVRLVAQYRSESTLRNSFTKPLAEKSHSGRIYPWHNTLGAKTGRFTCSTPK